MSLASGTLVDQLLEATPVPPADDDTLDTDAVLRAAAEMVAAREKILATAVREPVAGDDPRLAALMSRDTRWRELVGTHQARIGALRIAGVRVKAYRQK